MEAIFSILALRDQIAPPTINLDNPSVETRHRSGAASRPAKTDQCRAFQQLRLRRHQCERHFQDGAVTSRPRRRTAKPAKGSPRRSSIILPGVIAATILGLGLAQGAYFGRGPTARTGAATDVVLRPGLGAWGVATTLSGAGVIRSSILFVAAAKLTGAASELKAGEYLFPSQTSMAQVIDAMRKGAVVRRTVTIPEGVTSRAAAEILARSPDLTGEAPVVAEGSLLPETYDVRKGEPRVEVLQRMAQARDQLLATLWQARRPGLPYRAPEDAVVLASIVERETGKPDERRRVAAVFVNRLVKGMRLESDPTVVYGLTGGLPLGHGLRVSELQSRTPYNTYLVAGLPPTPIANPGRASLEAALDPAVNNDLYFVADGTGGHVFTDNYETHLRNVAHWRAIEPLKTGGTAS